MRLRFQSLLQPKAGEGSWELPSERLGFPGGSEVKVSASNVGDLGLIPGLGKPPGEGNDNLLQYPRLEEAGGLQSTGSQRGCPLQSTGSQRVGHD